MLGHWIHGSIKRISHLNVIRLIGATLLLQMLGVKYAEFHFISMRWRIYSIDEIFLISSPKSPFSDHHSPKKTFFLMQSNPKEMGNRITSPPLFHFCSSLCTLWVSECVTLWGSIFAFGGLTDWLKGRWNDALMNSMWMMSPEHTTAMYSFHPCNAAVCLKNWIE